MKILRLRGILPNIESVIPNDIKGQMLLKDLSELTRISNRIIEILDKAKKKRFVCGKCIKSDEAVITRDRKAYECDVCGEYAETLYLYKEPKDGKK